MPPRAKSPRKKKGPSTEKAKSIISLRDSLIADGKDPEKVGMACKGMYKCDKEADEACLDGIMKKLETIKTGGGSSHRRRSRARVRSTSRTKRKTKK